MHEVAQRQQAPAGTSIEGWGWGAVVLGAAQPLLQQQRITVALAVRTGDAAVPWWPQLAPCLTVTQALWLAAQVASLELLQAPGLPYQLPRQLAGYPALAGTAGHLRMRSEPVEAACVTLCWRRVLQRLDVQAVTVQACRGCAECRARPPRLARRER